MSQDSRSAELAIIISYPTSAGGIIVLLKTPPKYRKLDYNQEGGGDSIVFEYLSETDSSLPV